MENQTRAFVIGGSLSALGITKALGRKKIPVSVFHKSKDTIISASRYADLFLSPDPEKEAQNFLEFLINKQKELNKPSVLLPSNDTAIVFMSRNRRELARHFHFVLADEQTLEKLVSKDGFGELSNQYGLPAPKTYPVNSWNDAKRLNSELDFPCLIKPVYAFSWRNKRILDRYGSIKVLVINSLAELEESLNFLTPIDPELVIQEIIPGPDSNHYSVLNYISRDKTKIVSFVGRKFHMTPVHWGVGALVESVYEPELIKLAADFLRACGFCGFASLQLKMDSVRNKVYGIELNARFNMWNILGSHCGIDFAYLYYLDSLSLPLEVPKPYRTGLKWVSFEREIGAYLGYRQEQKFSTIGWLKDFKGKKVYAELSIDDPGPILFSVWSVLKTVFIKIGALAKKLLPF